MKKASLIFAAALAIVAASARPVAVGHRGCGIGLENSAESFRNGVALGYDFLETDIRITKDTVIVCSHDEDTHRLGGSKVVKESTLAELKSENLKQTRRGKEYTGTICTLDEYLQICKDGGVRPLIELKWAEGINSNDCSNMHLLIEALDRTCMRDKCIILTSMKPCLEHIRTNYPDIKLQFLTGKYWANHFDWCVKWNLDADIQITHFDKEIGRAHV